VGKRTRERWWCGWRLILYVYTQLHIIIDTEAFYRGTVRAYRRSSQSYLSRRPLLLFHKKFTVVLFQPSSFSGEYFPRSVRFVRSFVRSFVGVLIEIDAGRSVLSFEKVSSSPTKDSLSPHFSSRRRRERETCARAKAITARVASYRIASSSSPSSS
jgi:hypothetical protein